MKFWVSPLSRRERDLTESAEPETLSSGVPRSARGAEGTGRYPGLPADLCCPAFCPPRFNFPRFVEQSLQQTALELESVLFKARPGESAPSFTMSPLGPGGGCPSFMMSRGCTGLACPLRDSHRAQVSVSSYQICSFSWFCVHGFAFSVSVIEPVSVDFGKNSPG